MKSKIKIENDSGENTNDDYLEPLEVTDSVRPREQPE